jgi:hypothetical protein
MLEPGTRVPVKFVRHGKEEQTTVLIAERASGVELRALQIVVAPLSAIEAKKAELRVGVGLRVVYVNPRGPTSGELRRTTPSGASGTSPKPPASHCWAATSQTRVFPSGPKSSRQ